MSEAIDYRPTQEINGVDRDPRPEMESQDDRTQPRESGASLTLAIFRTRSLRSFATPCHGRGASF